MSKSRRTKGRPQPLYNSDKLMRQVTQKLIEDLRIYTGSPDLARDLEVSVARGLWGRDVTWPAIHQSPPRVFKAVHQLKNFLKRYIAQGEAENLEADAHKKFCEIQQRVGLPLRLRASTILVIRRARRICREILGKYDKDEHIRYCRFGTRATFGNSLRQSYLDCKVAGRLTGSIAHQRWFYTMLEGDPLLREILAPIESPPFSESLDWPSTRILNLTNVPKAWDKKRPILPNSTVGNYISYGLGKVIEERLRQNAGLDIKKLQAIHRELVLDMSVKRHLVTGDVSTASECFASDVVNMLLPREWFNVLKHGRIGTAHTPFGDIYLSSFMAMGIGFTFPLQTLLFYSLLRAIKELAHVSGRISVYGDDLIYPVKMHKYVIRIFPELRLILNLDKTFAKTFFRESCGADAYHGIDVRPCQPEGVYTEHKRHPYLALLYKLYNLLVKRWGEVDIPMTCDFLLREIARVQGCIFQVPADMPETCGIKTHQVRLDVDYPYVLPEAEEISRNQFSITFPYLRKVQRNRLISDEAIYYWSALQSRAVDPCSCEQLAYSESPDDFNMYGSSRETLRTVRNPRRKKPLKFIKTWVKGEREPLYSVIPVCDDKSSYKWLVNTGSTPWWDRDNG